MTLCGLKSHKVTHPDIPQLMNYECDQCDSRSMQKGSLEKHKISTHEVIVTRYPCNQCESKALTLGGLKSNKITHPDVL